MYYSIPSVKEATFKGANVDISTLRADSIDGTASSSSRGEGEVTRQTRLTFECAADKYLLEQFCANSEYDDDDDMESDDDESDWFEGYLSLMPVADSGSARQ